jgi:hypothetical protein
MSERRGQWTRPAAVLAVLLAAGCADGLLAELDRVADDPTVTAPAVVSFLDELSISVTWPADPAADGYVLERADDAVVPSYAVVQRGGATAFVDTACGDQRRYLYRVSAFKGERLFGPSPAAFGIGSATCRDSLEPNDTEAAATILDYDCSANLYYYRSFAGAEIRDVDWYAVVVPPQRRANIVVTQVSPAPAGVATALIFYLKGTVPQPVTNSLAIAVANPANESRTFLFEISPDPDRVVLDPSLAGGSTIDYTVSLASIAGL